MTEGATVESTFEVVTAFDDEGRVGPCVILGHCFNVVPDVLGAVAFVLHLLGRRLGIEIGGIDKQAAGISLCSCGFQFLFISVEQIKPIRNRWI